MIKGRMILVVMLMMVSLLVAACADKKQLDDIEKTQKEILAKMNEIEAIQKGSPAAEGKVDNKALEEIANTQKTILARINAMDEKQKEMLKFFQPRMQAADPNQVYNLPVGNSAVKGKRDAAVTIVEFSDFQCPYCSKLQPTLSQVLAAYPNDVKLVFKDFPLSFHQHARNAAKAARAAGEQGKFWEMHDLIFENFNQLSDNSFKEFAAKLKLDMNRFNADFSSNKYDGLIEQDINLGRSANVTGTPTLYLNGKKMTSRSFDDFKNTIDQYLKKK